MTREMWCPRCEDWTSLVATGRCAWCGGKLDEQRKRRGGWKRPDLAGGKLSDKQLRALHLAHVHQGMSINALAKQIHERVGYRSHHSAAVCISQGWKRLGLRARDRIEATRLASTTHGQGARDRDEQAYRRFLAAQRGWIALTRPGRPRCSAMKVNPPGAGERCSRPSLTDSEFCQSHDPRRESHRRAHLAHLRARQSRPEMLEMGPFVVWLQRLAAEHGSIRGAARAHGLPVSAFYYYVRGRGTSTTGPKLTIGAATVGRWASLAATTVDEIYAATPKDESVCHV